MTGASHSGCDLPACHRARAAAWCVALLLASGVACKQETVAAFPDSYVGVGVELTISDGQPRVVRVIPGGPAALAGMQDGMVITHVAGESMQGKSLAEVVTALRGPPGTSVALRLEHEGKTFPVSLLRQPLSRADGGGAYRTGQAH